MNPLALAVVVAAAAVWVGQWISLRARATAGDLPLPPRLRTRLVWWGAHRTVVGIACGAVAALALTGGVLTG